MEEAFERVEGVSTVTSGFAGQVEAVEIIYDPEKVELQKVTGSILEKHRPN